MKPQRLSVKILRDPVHVIATGLGVGLSPWAPGTAGSLLALIPCWWLLQMTWPIQLLIAVVAFVVGVPICGVSARRLGTHDHPGIVFDEIAAMFILMLATPPTGFGLLAAFILFRIFDIFKPWPIRDLDHRLHGGLGIMLDDQLAAGYAAICLVAIKHGFATF